MRADNDQATLALMVMTQSRNATDARELAANVSTAVMDAIEGLGVDRKDISTETITVLPAYEEVCRNENGTVVTSEYEGPQNCTMQEVWYEVQNAMTVLLRNVNATSSTLTSDVLTAVVEAGGNNLKIESLTFRVRLRTFCTVNCISPYYLAA